MSERLDALLEDITIQFTPIIKDEQSGFDQFLSIISKQKQTDPQGFYARLGSILTIRKCIKDDYGNGTTDLKLDVDSMHIWALSGEINSQILAYQVLALKQLEDPNKYDIPSMEVLKKTGLDFADLIDNTLNDEAQKGLRAKTLQEIGKWFLDALDNFIAQLQKPDDSELSPEQKHMKEIISFAPVTRGIFRDATWSKNQLIEKTLPQISAHINSIIQMEPIEKGEDLGHLIIGFANHIAKSTQNAELGNDKEFQDTLADFAAKIDAHIAYNAISQRVGYAMSWEEAVEKIMDYIRTDKITPIFDSSPWGSPHGSVGIDFIEKVVYHIVD